VRLAGTLLALLLGAALAGCSSTSAPAADEAGQSSGPIWQDGFDGAAGTAPNPDHWTAETGGEWGDNELQQYTDRPENAALDGDGHLAITANEETYTGYDGVTRDFTSARLTTYKKFDFEYGTVEARIKVPKGKGLVAGFWALGSDIAEVGWPESGEFDVVEVVGEKPSIAHGSLHGPGVGEKGWAQTDEYQATEPHSHHWHVYAATWTPEYIEFSIDGLVYSRRTPDGLPVGARWPFDRPMHLLLTLSVGGPWAGPPDETPEWPARKLVDWIRVWR
jgi:beta-glucanase (GH16 family)